MITMRPTEDSKSRYHQAFDALHHALDIDAFEMFKVGHEIWADRVHEIFEMEGDPGWRKLKPRTMEERAMYPGHGFAPDHPILHRQGVLEQSLTDRNARARTTTLLNATPDDPVLVGNTTDVVMSSRGTTWRFAVMDERFWPLHDATGYRWPPRPMVPIGGQRDEVGREIEKRLIEMVRNG